MMTWAVRIGDAQTEPTRVRQPLWQPEGPREAHQRLRLMFEGGGAGRTTVYGANHSSKADAIRVKDSPSAQPRKASKQTSGEYWRRYGCGQLVGS